jgi:spore germination cell wall hydrolase CwlJ-like protein
MRRSFQSILLFTSLILCVSFIMIAEPCEDTDPNSLDKKPNTTENRLNVEDDPMTDNISTNNGEISIDHNLQDISSGVDQTYDIPNMYIVRRGGTDRNRSDGILSDVNANDEPAKTSEAAPEKTAKNTGSSAAKSLSKPANHDTAKTNDTKQKTEDELDLLARLITAEAQGEPYETKVAVGAVVMNRVKSSQFPNTIKEVIYQNIDGYYQFTPVVNGWIDKPAHSDCVQAAKEVIAGKDPTNGALFFYSNRSTNPWLLEKPIAFKSGNMIFAY